MNKVSASTQASSCALCADPLPGLLLKTDQWSIIDAQDPDFPGFTRVVWNAHVAEMTDLSEQERQRLMYVVFSVERIMREVLRPEKINLACLGNQVAHIHWHIIARWHDDLAFPAPIWSKGHQTDRSRARREDTKSRLAHYHEVLTTRLTTELP